MDGSGRETEIKLRFGSVAEARERLEPLGLTLLAARAFEDNVLFDRKQEPLAPAGKLLRLRRFGDRALLTYKAPAFGSGRYKVRREEETHVAEPQAFERILDGLGFAPVYRYQKHRTIYALDALQICLDETPLGCFVELEGTPAAIDDTAARLGFGLDDYIVDSYRDLQTRAARERGEEAGDMLMPENP
jgi:adenylate cyclase class 2